MIDRSPWHRAVAETLALFYRDMACPPRAWRQLEHRWLERLSVDPRGLDGEAVAALLPEGRWVWFDYERMEAYFVDPGRHAPLVPIQVENLTLVPAIGEVSLPQLRWRELIDLLSSQEIAALLKTRQCWEGPAPRDRAGHEARLLEQEATMRWFCEQYVERRNRRRIRDAIRRHRRLRHQAIADALALSIQQMAYKRYQAQRRDAQPTASAPWWRFTAVRDPRCPEFLELRDGITLPPDHPWWQQNTPPLMIGDRSSRVPVAPEATGGVEPTPREALPEPPPFPDLFPSLVGADSRVD